MPEIELVGAGGEPVDWRRTMASHGVADLLPNRLDDERWTFATVLDMLEVDEIGLAALYVGASLAVGFAAILVTTNLVRRARLTG